MPRSPQSQTPQINKGNTWVNKTETPHPTGFYRELILGDSQTGKSTYTKTAVIHEAPKYDRIILVGPNVLDEEYGLKDIVDKTGKVSSVYLDFEKNDTKKFYKELKQNKADGLRTMVVVDDPVGIAHFCQPANRKSPWNQFVCNIKFWKCSLKFSTQGSHSLAPICRKQMERIVFFPDYSCRNESYAICQVVPKPKFMALLDTYSTDAYSALVVVKQFGRCGLYALKPGMKISPITKLPDIEP